MNYRIIYSDNGVLSDKSVVLNEYFSGSTVLPFVAVQDKLYFGSRFPFNSLYLKFSVLNIIDTVMSVDIWDGNQWRTTVDLIDETNGFKSSGYFSFVPNKNESGWASDDTVLSNGAEKVIGLGDVEIYDLFWMRISLSADITLTTTLDWVGHIFCSDEDLYAEYPMFNKTSLKTAFKSGKTDWEEQRVKASNLIIEDMIHRGLIINPGQILDRSKLKQACISKTAQVIYNSMGDDYTDQTIAALNEYNLRIKNGIYNIDSNNNAILDKQETVIRQGYLTR